MLICLARIQILTAIIKILSISKTSFFINQCMLFNKSAHFNVKLMSIFEAINDIEFIKALRIISSLFSLTNLHSFVKDI